jgi:hypothetical protein
MANDADKPVSESSSLAPLGREEYVEQAHFFRSLAERLRENVPMQEVLGTVREEVLATTKLPMAIDFLLAELRHSGILGSAMARLEHYFTPFQVFVVQESEDERRRFDLRIGLEVLRREAEYRSESPTPQGVFLYQFEAISRNRLGYDRGLEAVARDPGFDDTWRDWIRTMRRQIGMVDLADLIYVHSEYYYQRAGSSSTPREHAAPGSIAKKAENLGAEDGPARAAREARDPAAIVLFGEREGRIALANRRKDPLYLFASLHRQLGYPEVPRPKLVENDQLQLPQLARRLEQFEARLKLVEDEQRGGIDLTKFYQRPDAPPPEE